MPAILRASDSGLTLLDDGPFQSLGCGPEALFGMSSMDALSHGVFWSLSLNIVTFVGVSLMRSPGLRERLQAAKFLEVRR